MLNSDKHERYRSYKRKKTWMYATITGIASVLGGGSIAVPMIKADTTSTNDSQAKEVGSTSQLLVNQKSSTIPATNLASNSNATITISDHNPSSNGWYVNVDGYFTQGIAIVDGNSSKVIVILIPKNDPTQTFVAEGSHSSGNTIITGPIKKVTSSGTTVWNINASLNGTVNNGGISITPGSRHEIEVKYRMASGDANGDRINDFFGSGHYYAHWDPYPPTKSNVTVKFMDESGREISDSISMNFWSDIQQYTISGIAPHINGLVFDHANGKLTDIKSNTVTLIYKQDIISESDSTSDSLSDSVSNSDSASDSVSDSDSNNESGYLPKTGDENGSYNEVGGMLVGLGMMAAIATKKRKEKNEN